MMFGIMYNYHSSQYSFSDKKAQELKEEFAQGDCHAAFILFMHYQRDMFSNDEDAGIWARKWDSCVAYRQRTMQ